MKTFQKNRLTLALLSAGLFATYPTFAEEKPADETANVEVISVTGVRLSVLNALDEKRDADVVGDFVGAGDLGVLPDPSIADSLGRLTGVTTVRSSGQSSQLNIRGMNGDFIQSTLNGREQATTSAETESSRWMAFDQYPAELITSAAVYKSPKASHIEGGVAGTVELKTANPLRAEKEHNFTASARASYNDAAKDVGADEFGNKYGFTYQGKFLDNTLGLGVGYSHLTQPNNFEGSRAGADGQIGYTQGENSHVRAMQFQAGSGEDKRDGYLATVVYQPVETLKVQLDYFKSEYESQDLRHGITIGGLTDTNTFTYSDLTTDASGTITGGTVNITNPNTTYDSSPWFETRSEDQSTQADSDAFGLNIDWQVTEHATLNFDISHSEGKKTRKDRIASLHAYEFGTATGLDGNGMSVTGPTWQELSGQSMSYQSNGDETPNITIDRNGVPLDLTNLDYMRLSRYEEYPHTYTDEIDTIKVDFKYDFDQGFITSIETGFRTSERTFDSQRGAFLYGSRDGQFNIVNGDGEFESYCADNITVPTILCQPQSVDGFTSVGSVKGAPDHLVINLDGLADDIFGAGNYQGKQVFSRDWTFVESGAVKEKTDAVYLMANFATDIGSVALTGNVGVRHVRSDVKSIGVQNVGDGNGVPITDDVGVTQDNYDYVNYGPEFSDTLPSLNLNFQISDDDVIRFAAAKVMARPPAGQLKGGAGSWLSGDGGTVYNVWSKGSPYLDPFRATQYDLSYEHYLEDGGAFTAAVFYKSIESLVNDVSYGPDDEWPGLEVPAGFTKGQYNTKENSNGGYIRGLELAITKNFVDLPGVFSGLGINANYSYTESETEISGGGLFSQKLPLPGLSKNIWSFTAFWDIDNFSTHMNIRYRDDFIENMAVPGSSTPVYAKDYMTVDLQASYAFDNGVSVVIQGNNLTDEANKADYGNASLLGEYKTFGRQYYLGVNYKY